MTRARAARVILTAVAGYQMRGLGACIAHALGRIGTPPAGAMWLVGLLGLLAGWMLWQTGRGLRRVAVAPRWTLRLLGLMLMAGSAAVVLISAANALGSHSLPGHSGLPDGVAATLGPALGTALMGLVAVGGIGWLIRRPVSWSVGARDPGAGALGPAMAGEWRIAPPPWLAGWSVRGPPPRLTGTTDLCRAA